jgi:probable rRNA maturation factor
MIDVEVLGSSLARAAPAPQEIRRLCELAAASAGIDRAHVAIEFVDVRQIAQLNAEHRGGSGPTDVLSFPIDGVESLAGVDPLGAAGLGAAGPGAAGRPALAAQAPPRELGDVVICPECTADLREAIVHGMLHLLGMDHETDDGEMLALQSELLAGAGG